MIRLLLVDNDTEILELLRIGLENMGYSVRTAESGLAALRAIEEELPDVLITDLVMPNISGEKLLKIVRAVPEWKSLKTIVISGVAAEAPEIRTRILCDIYIAKGPIASTLKYLQDSLNHFERMRAMSAAGVVGINEIHSRHITRELLEFKAEIDTIMDQITDGVCRLDTAGTVLWINHQFSRLLNLPEESVLGRNLLDFLNEPYRETFRSFLSDSATTPVEIELEWNDHRRLIRASLLSPTAENDPFVTVLWQDVTDRLLSEEHYENIVESASDLILTTDLDGRINYVSRSSVRLLGLSAQEMIGRFPWDLVVETEHLRSRDRIRSAIARFTGDSTVDHDVWETRLADVDGEEHIVEVSCSPFRNRANRTMGVQLVVMDITQRRHLEDEREALLHEVQHRVRDNLQLVVSLVRVSGPDRMDTRIAAVAEVFDELYREKSFARIKTQALLERVIALGIGEESECDQPSATYRIDAEHLPMRTAVPLSLVVVEILGSLCGENNQCAELTISFYTRGEELELSIECGFPERSTDAEPGEFSEEEPEEDGILAILVSQLHGRCRIHRSRDSLRYVVTFVPERLVP